MCVRVAFIGDSNRFCQGKGVEFTAKFLRCKEVYWNQFKLESGEPVMLSTVMEDIGYNVADVAVMSFELYEQIKRGYWSEEIDDLIDFGMTFDEQGHFLLNFNCKLKEPEQVKEPQQEKKPCYFWKQYKYHVDISQITLKGWVEWCNELYEIQHGKPRPKNNRIFINPEMAVATVKGRFWNKDKIEKWLNDHGYKWTRTVETKYQFHFDNPDSVNLIDSDEELRNKKSA
jgi:hypothetical protein